MEKTLILLRGLPGSGKSTTAQLFRGAIHFEADMYFTDADGTYNFVPEKIKDAHNWCRHQTMEAMKDGLSLVIVSNTFTMEWEMEPYYLLAEELGYRVVSMIVENRHGGKNIHDCPEDKVEIMRQRFEVKL
jgi:predicted kinase